MGIVKKARIGLPWRYSGWEPAWQCRGHRFNPCSRKILPPNQVWSPLLLRARGAATAGPVCCTARLKPAHLCCSTRKPLQWAACETQQKESPACSQRATAVRTQNSQTKVEKENDRRECQTEEYVNRNPSFQLHQAKGFLKNETEKDDFITCLLPQIISYHRSTANRRENYLYQKSPTCLTLIPGKLDIILSLHHSQR